MARIIREGRSVGYFCYIPLALAPPPHIANIAPRPFSARSHLIYLLGPKQAK